MVVAEIHTGHEIRMTDGSDVYTVRGSMKLRGRYFYVVTTQAGRKATISREEVFEAQRDGSAIIA